VILDEEPDEFFADDFGNDDAPSSPLLLPLALVGGETWDDDELDDFFADDFGNDDRPGPRAPVGLVATVG
jgi:hypothetical protein